MGLNFAFYPLSFSTGIGIALQYPVALSKGCQECDFICSNGLA